MGSKSDIEWTDATWNPVTGCTKISQGCKNCYAEKMAHRLQAMGQSNYHNGFGLTLHPHMLEKPLRWSKPRRIFVNSMSDLFHKDVPFDFIQRVFDVMGRAHWHTFQVLTKRSERLKESNRLINWPDNVWMGVSVENADVKGRIDDLRSTSARVKFLSIEPMIGSVGDLNLDGIDWVIVGGESGPGARPIAPTWVRDVRDQCQAQGVAFFFKQWGGVRKSQTGRILDGRTWDEFPKTLQSKSGGSHE